jgi:hypothetical protein
MPMRVRNLRAVEKSLLAMAAIAIVWFGFIEERFFPLPRPRAAEAGAAFATPTIVHFGTTLLLSALVRVPWQSIILAAALWGLIGLVCKSRPSAVSMGAIRWTLHYRNRSIPPPPSGYGMAIGGLASLLTLDSPQSS